jgi:DNA repair protein RadA
VTTNQVNSEPDSFSQKSQIPAGGNILAHASKHRIEMRAIGKNIHAQIFSSASLPCLDARFSINKCGIVDVL